MRQVCYPAPQPNHEFNLKGTTMRQTLFLCLVATLVVAFIPAYACAQKTVQERVEDLENRVDQLDRSLESKSSIGAVLFLYGVFCALWAQNTGRNPWLWFFTGALFNVITVIVLLVKNSNDRKHRHKKNQTGETDA